MTTIATASTFIRDRFTWTTYLLLGFYAYVIATIGPIMPFVREKLSLNYTTTGLHITAFALGMVIAGLIGAAVVHRLGRKRVFWGGGLGMCIGGVLFMVGQAAPITILGCFMMGCLGSFMLVMIQATLTDHQPQYSAIALTESNIMAAIFAALAPILVGFGETSGITWRLAIIFAIGLWVFLFATNRDMSLPAAQVSSEPSATSGKLPRVFWLYWVVIFISVAMEWCVVFWSADFMNRIVLLPKEQASSATSIFLVAMVIGRAMGSRLTRKYLPRQLIWLAIGFVAVGFPFFWLGQGSWVNMLGLFIVGLGIANLFPFALAAAARSAAHASDLASARVALASGTAILIVPQILGSTADVIGIFNAFAIVPVFLLGLMVVTGIANRLPR